MDYVYLWVNGIHLRVRLVSRIGCASWWCSVSGRTAPRVIAVEDGYRESNESWAASLRDLKRRGMKARAPAVGDGALAFWAAHRDVWPETVTQRDWVHRLANVLDKLPKRLQSTAKEPLGQIMAAPMRAQAQQEIARFSAEYGGKYPKAVASLTRDQEALLAF